MTEPWKQPGAVRRHYEPHRGPFLHFLGAASVLGGFVSLCICAATLVALPVGVTVWVLAARDLREMKAGRMDPQGWGNTFAARQFAVGAVVLSLLSWGIWSVLAALLLLDHVRW
jgi:hypothetical protein